MSYVERYLNITNTFVKPKYLRITDSERVARAKGEKASKHGVARETEISGLQTVRALFQSDSVPFAEGSNKLICIASQEA
jgi:hypothetical protein